MSDYSDEDFEMSGSGTVETFKTKLTGNPTQKGESSVHASRITSNLGGDSIIGGLRTGNAGLPPRGLTNANPFKGKSGRTGAGGDFNLAADDDDDNEVGDDQIEDDIDGYAPGGQGPTSGSGDYEDDDFDEDEEEDFKATAVEFAKKLTALRESSKYEYAEGGEEPSQSKGGGGKSS